MSLIDKTSEIQRLVSAFEKEAEAFHDIQFHVYYLTQDDSSFEARRFAQPNHAIALWQYYGVLGGEQDIQRFEKNLKESDLKWGLRGASLNCIGVLEGDATPLFVRMAVRAGSLFSEEESRYIKSRVVREIQDREKGKAKPTAALNDNPLAVWLNFLLYHLSLLSPGRDRAHKIEPDPFSLSLLALERLLTDKVVGKSDRSSSAIVDINFKVALSFPGEKRQYVSKVVDALRGPLGKDAVFYDFDYQAQLARPNLDTLLQRVYREQSDLVVVFLCAEYGRKEWCGLEWRAVRDIIKAREDGRVMFVRFDEAPIEGFLSIDGYVDGSSHTSEEVASFILTRVAELESIASSGGAGLP